MVIILDGSSPLGRTAIAEQAVIQNPSWQHLALEVLARAATNKEEWAFHLELITRCVDELAQEGMHLLLTMPEGAEQTRSIVEALKPEGTSVHIGLEGDGAYDYYISPGLTVNDAAAYLRTLMIPSIRS